MRTRVLVCFIVLICGAARAVRAEQRPGALFNRRCGACHTFGRGDLIGPDLNGVTDRHSREWLRKWISSSQTLVRGGEPAAVALFKRYRQFPMPDQAFAPAELDALLDYFASGGPIAEARRNRRAEQATVADVENGRALFRGERVAASGGAACMACHRLAGEPVGGNLGPDLTHVYSKYQDRRVAALISRGCFPRVPGGSAGKALNDEEAFALKAFLQSVDPIQNAARRESDIRANAK